MYTHSAYVDPDPIPSLTNPPCGGDMGTAEAQNSAVVETASSISKGSRWIHASVAMNKANSSQSTPKQRHLNGLSAEKWAACFQAARNRRPCSGVPAPPQHAPESAREKREALVQWMAGITGPDEKGDPVDTKVDTALIERLSVRDTAVPRLARPPGRDRATNTEPGPPDGADGGLQQLAQRLAAALALAGVGGAGAEQPFLAAVEAERVRAEEEYRRKLALLDRYLEQFWEETKHFVDNSWEEPLAACFDGGGGEALLTDPRGWPSTPAADRSRAVRETPPLQGSLDDSGGRAAPFLHAAQRSFNAVELSMTASSPSHPPLEQMQHMIERKLLASAVLAGSCPEAHAEELRIAIVGEPWLPDSALESALWSSGAATFPGPGPDPPGVPAGWPPEAPLSRAMPFGRSTTYQNVECAHSSTAHDQLPEAQADGVCKVSWMSFIDEMTEAEEEVRRQLAQLDRLQAGIILGSVSSQSAGCEKLLSSKSE
eukprot:EG_transcript_6284